MVKISPSILSADFNNLGTEVKAISEGGGDLIHIDIMDGHFVPNLTIGHSVVKALRKNTELPFDVHLMIDDPDKYILKFIEAGANIIAVHPEACVHLHRTINLIKEHNVKAAVALNPSTTISSIEHVLEDLDMIVVMTVNPGFPAQKFINTMLPKIQKLRQLIQERGLKIDIEVDGGINAENAHVVAQAGADILVAGNAVFNGPAPTVAENILMLKEAVNKS
ncbi:ribulose-phosphate 3-epimerase [[Eubacterium] cellulosolvens]